MSDTDSFDPYEQSWVDLCRSKGGLKLGPGSDGEGLEKLASGLLAGLEGGTSNG